ncbi:hypothetical protein [Acidaminococcus massiliensis]|mgnify:FL=1|uniref:hypothetical protein n=1 Tax=Acidaminococcus massiliensis TaxID=1852375 RepID=UPI0023F3A562|nr:hypothetical protein [Acidaminococcus massiliensis]
MKKTVSLLILCFAFALAAVCQARPLPNSEFSLGGLNVTHCTLDYASGIYGSQNISRMMAGISSTIMGTASS